MYFITVHPDGKTAHTFSSFDVAVDRAREAAKKLGRQLQVWREVGDERGFERLKTSD